MFFVLLSSLFMTFSLGFRFEGAPLPGPPHHAWEPGREAVTWVLLWWPRYAVCAGASGVAGRAGGAVGVVTAGAGVRGDGSDALGGAAGGTGDAVEVGVGAEGAAVGGAVGVTVPLIAAFCFDPIVWRAARGALAFAAAASFSSGVATCCARAVSPKSASVSR